MNVSELFWSRRFRVFDLDGTLVHTLNDLAGALNQAVREMGFKPVPTTLVRASLHAGLEGTVAAAVTYLRLPHEVQAPMLARYRRRYAEGLVLRSTPYDGVPEMLAHLSARGDAMAVCTNKPERQAEDLLVALGLRRHFAVVVGGDTCGECKPHPAPLRRALVRLGAAPSESLLVGDSNVDNACAQGAGVPHVWFTQGYGAPPATYPWCLDSYRALLSSAGPIQRAARVPLTAAVDCA
jgi:phosphoglycolate phosphatase